MAKGSLTLGAAFLRGLVVAVVVAAVLGFFAIIFY